MSEKQPGDLSPNVRHARYARSHHRAKQHADAHAEVPGPAHAVPHIGGVPRGDADLIANDADLAALLDHLRQVGSFAYDSEFIGELTYVPKLCLIQVATTERVALIDPLDGLDLKPFWEIIADASVEKIAHAGDQDVEPVVRHLGRRAENVFDTQIACGFVGMAYPVALSKLVGELVGAKLGKGLTFTHWDQRPLTPAQLRYAADDVRYLPRLRAEIGKRLDATGHADWARQEFDAMCDPGLYRFDPQTAYLRVRGATSLGPQALAILRELVIWRDAVARAHDVPPRAFLKDEILVDLSRQPVKTLEKLDRVRGLPRPVEHAHGREIVEATLRGLATSPDQFPFARTIEPSPTERFRADALWALAQRLCIGNSIDPSLVTSRQEIGDFLRQVPSEKDSPGEPDSPLMKGWRRAALGDPLIDLLTRGGKVSLDWNGQSLRTL